MRRGVFLPLLAAAALFTACTDTNPPATRVVGPSLGLSSRPAVTVMSRNMYLGADIDALIAPGADPAQVLPVALAQLFHNDFASRAQRMAAEIALRSPDVVGLQEVTHYNFAMGGPVQPLDFLDVLQLYLQGMGAHYDVAVRQENVSLRLPLSASTYVDYVDGDAILVRHGLTWSDPEEGHYTTQQELSVAGYDFSNLRGWNAVTVTSGGLTYRFVNTHLEIQAFRAVQEQQARELATLLADEPLPIVLVGDFNSAANSWAPAASKTDTYRILRNAGFADLEQRESHSATMVTCCHDANLSETTPTFNQRLDLVLARFGNAGFGGQSSIEVIVGQPFGFNGYTLWPSDHAGVYAQLWPAIGRLGE